MKLIFRSRLPLAEVLLSLPDYRSLISFVICCFNFFLVAERMKMINEENSCFVYDYLLFACSLVYFWDDYEGGGNAKLCFISSVH